MEESNKVNWIIIGIIVIILGLVIYFITEPSRVRSSCNQQALTKAEFPDGSYNQYLYTSTYDECLEKAGQTPPQAAAIPVPVD